jgi:thioredoxin reductase (NADPH)
MPRTDRLAGIIQHDTNGFILIGSVLIQNGQRPESWALDRQPMLLEINIPDIFVVGDVRHGSTKESLEGVDEGSIAIQLVHQYAKRDIR